MSTLLQFQRRVAAAVMQPLTRHDSMRRRASDGLSMVAEAEALVRPNKLLEPFERLEIYNRQYWFRVLNSFADDFPGLRAIVGGRKFERLMRAYLADCPSVSFTLRNLGARLEAWLAENSRWIQPRPQLAWDMVRLEWAHIETFDAGAEPILTPADIELAGDYLQIALQPYIRLLTLGYPVDDLLIAVHNQVEDADISSNAATQRKIRKHVRSYSDIPPEPIFLAVHRVDNSVYYKRLDLESYRMLDALLHHATLGTAIEAAFAGSAMPEDARISALQQWFSNWAELGWFCRTGSQWPGSGFQQISEAS